MDMKTVSKLGNAGFLSISWKLLYLNLYKHCNIYSYIVPYIFNYSTISSVLAMYHITISDMSVAACSVTQSCQTLCDSTRCSPPGSLSMRFSWQEYWSGLSFPTQGIFLTQGSNLHLLCLLQWQAGYLPLSHLGSPVSGIDDINMNKRLILPSRSV